MIDFKVGDIIRLNEKNRKNLSVLSDRSLRVTLLKVEKFIFNDDITVQIYVHDIELGDTFNIGYSHAIKNYELAIDEMRNEKLNKLLK